MAWRRKCAWCQQVKDMARKAQMYCSPRCAAYGRALKRDEEEMRLAGKRAGTISGLVRAARAKAKWDSMSKPQVFEQGYLKGYYSGKKRERRRQAEACGAAALHPPKPPAPSESP